MSPLLNDVDPLHDLYTNLSEKAQLALTLLTQKPEHRNKTSDVMRILSEMQPDDVSFLSDARFSKIDLRVPLLVYSWGAGFLSSMSVIALKSFGELVKSSGKFDNFHHVFTYLIILSCILFPVLQLTTFNTALKFYN